METITINTPEQDIERDKVNFYARQYYYRKLTTDPEFKKHINDKAKLHRERRKQMNEALNLPKPKIGRPRTKKEEATLEPKKRGPKPKYSMETYKLNINI